MSNVIENEKGGETSQKLSQQRPMRWKFVPNDEQPMLKEVQDETGRGICHVYHLNNQAWKFNLALIAAAPELLEACKHSVNDINRARRIVLELCKDNKLVEDTFGVTLRILSLAIAKAEGK